MDLFREYSQGCVTASVSCIPRLSFWYQIFASKIISQKKKVRKVYKFSLIMELVTVLWMKCIAKLNLLCYTSCQVDLN